MKELGIEEAGTQFSALLALVEGGEEILLTRDGEVVAELMPPRPLRQRARVDRALAEVRARMRDEGIQPVDAETIRSWIAEGRR